MGALPGSHDREFSNTSSHNFGIKFFLLTYYDRTLESSFTSWHLVTMAMRFLPVFLDTTSGPVVLVGSSEQALGKLRLLLAAGATVRWYPGERNDARELARSAAGPGSVAVDFRDPQVADLAGAITVVCAAGEGRDEAISVRARAAGIPVNVVDRPDLSTFIFPAIVDRGDVVVAIGTGGCAPVLARRLRERIEAIIPSRIGDLAALIGRFRRRVAEAKPKLSPRLFWQTIVDGPIGAATLAGQLPRAEADLARAIEAAPRLDQPGDAGCVFLVGAGPGDPDLLTLRALQVMQDADVVFYDELVTEAVLDRVRRDAKRVLVGKLRGEPGIGQDEINRRLVAAAQAGMRVVRLKGGDSFVFGRGGEELEHLRRHNIPVIVVPGITAALGCAAEAELPLTFRQEATRLVLVTAHRTDEATALDWTGLADRQTTVVVYMGLAAAPAVRNGLIAAGRDPATPAAVLARGTRPNSASAVGRLDDLASLAASAAGGPALLVIGDVVARSAPWRAALNRSNVPEAA
jgi:uroporphyrin-III C-methyltransferase/precorrin-2 dehydrogenase/sirohydrochlorin ferrochelatase